MAKQHVWYGEEIVHLIHKPLSKLLQRRVNHIVLPSFHYIGDWIE